MMTENTEIPAGTEEAAAPAAPEGSDTAVAAGTDSKAEAPAEGEGQGEADKGDEGDKPEESTEEEPQGAPEAYEPFELPEGWQLEGDRLAAVHEYAKSKNWTQAEAQGHLSKYAEFREAEREAERGALHLAAVEEFGNDFDAIAQGAQHGIALIEKQRPGAVARLAETNLGNHPDFLFAMSLLSKTLKEPALPGLRGDPPADGPKTVGDRAYQYAEKPDKRRP